MNAVASQWGRWTLALLAGVLFALGLGLAGMTDPKVVIAFLDLSGSWNPNLAMVMVGAIGVHSVAYALKSRRSRPWIGEEFSMPPRTRVDRELILGSALFGGGWGLVGVCPGPAIVSLVSGAKEIWMFVGAMLAGLWIVTWVQQRIRP